MQGPSKRYARNCADAMEPETRTYPMNWFIVLCLLLSCAEARSELVADQPRPATGRVEIIAYDLTYFGLPASSIVFETRSPCDSSKILIHAEARSSGLWSKLFRVDNRYQTRIDRRRLLPVEYSKQIDQKNVQHAWTITYHQDQQRAVIDSARVWSIPSDCHNFFSMLYRIRRFDFERGDSLVLNLDVETLLWRVTIRREAFEALSTPEGKFDAIKLACDFEPLNPDYKRPWKTDVLTNRIARADATGYIWISRDAPRVLLKIDYQFSVAALHARLRKIYRLK